MLSQQDIYKLFDARGIAYRRCEHVAVFTAEEALAADIPAWGVFAKNLFVCDNKKRDFKLICAPLEKRVDLKAVADRLGCKRLRLAPADLLPRMLGVEQGSVTPLALFNDEAREVELVLDAQLADQVVGVHPLVNTATVYVAVADVMALLRELGNGVRIVECGPAEEER